MVLKFDDSCGWFSCSYREFKKWCKGNGVKFTPAVKDVYTYSLTSYKDRLTEKPYKCAYVRKGKAKKNVSVHRKHYLLLYKFRVALKENNQEDMLDIVNEVNALYAAS